MPKEQSTQTPSFISEKVSESDYFFLDLTPDPKTNFAVVCGGLEFCSKDYEIERNGFDYYALEYISSGECKLVLEDTEFNLKAGSIFCYSPDTTHRIKNEGNSVLSKFFVDFVGSEVEDLLRGPFFINPQPYQISDLRILHDLFYQVMDAGKLGAPSAQHTLRLLIKLIVAQAETKAVNIEAFSSMSYVTYERCIALMEKHFLEIQSISELANACNVSGGYLSRIVKKYAGVSPSEILTRYKLNRAADLILRENMMIKEVAFATGFDDPYYFSRLFKKHYGLSPQNFRKSISRV